MRRCLILLLALILCASAALAEEAFPRGTFTEETWESASLGLGFRLDGMTFLDEEETDAYWQKLPEALREIIPAEPVMAALWPNSQDAAAVAAVEVGDVPGLSLMRFFGDGAAADSLALAAGPALKGAGLSDVSAQRVSVTLGGRELAGIRLSFQYRKTLHCAVLALAFQGDTLAVIAASTAQADNTDIILGRFYSLDEQP